MGPSDGTRGDQLWPGYYLGTAGGKAETHIVSPHLMSSIGSVTLSEPAERNPFWHRRIDINRS